MTCSRGGNAAQTPCPLLWSHARSSNLRHVLNVTMASHLLTCTGTAPAALNPASTSSSSSMRLGGGTGRGRGSAGAGFCSGGWAGCGTESGSGSGSYAVTVKMLHGYRVL